MTNPSYSLPLCSGARRLFRWNRFDFFVSMTSVSDLVVSYVVDDLVSVDKEKGTQKYRWVVHRLRLGFGKR